MRYSVRVVPFKQKNKAFYQIVALKAWLSGSKGWLTGSQGGVQAGDQIIKVYCIRNGRAIWAGWQIWKARFLLADPSLRGNSLFRSVREKRNIDSLSGLKVDLPSLRGLDTHNARILVSALQLCQSEKIALLKISKSCWFRKWYWSLTLSPVPKRRLRPSLWRQNILNGKLPTSHWSN